MKHVYNIILVLILYACFALNAPAYASSVSLHEDVLGEDYQLEIEVSPSVSTQTVTIDLGGGQPKPGERPKVNVLGIDVPAMMVFESPFSIGTARLYNTAESTVVVVYQLRISVAELRRQAGITGYSAQQYEALLAGEGFDPESSYIVLSQTKGILPGGWVEEMALGTLPDGRTLPAGSYTAELVMVPFDSETRQSMMLSAVVMIPFVVENDLIALDIQDNVMDLSLFNPVDADRNLIYSIQVSQSELERVSGAPHQDEETLKRQEGTPGFDSAYEFISLYESEPVMPGGYLEGLQLNALPDGAHLPKGEYTGWLVRYAVDAQSGERVMLEVNTQLQLVVH